MFRHFFLQGFFFGLGFIVIHVVVTLGMLAYQTFREVFLEAH